jgi:UDP-glucuronate 4-epimerase
MRFLITGTAGFIGFHLARRLVADGHEVVGIDGLTPYYDVALKKARHAELARDKRFTPHVVMLEDTAKLAAIYDATKPEIVVHLAAQAGVRYGLENPRAFIDSNLVGTFNLLERLRAAPPKHFLFASTSSIYGANPPPTAETDRADYPLSLYAATKKAGELMAHAYAHLWAIPTTSIRFFTVYGPWGRPDMALFRFVSAMLKDEPIELYGEGRMSRDFTYVDDLIEAMVRLVPVVPRRADPDTDAPDFGSPVAPFRVVNVGRGAATGLLDFVVAIENKLGKQAKRKLLPMQPGDVPATHARADLLERLTGYRPQTPVEQGVAAFVDWYRAYYKV